MNEEICCITNEGKTAKSEWENDDRNFFQALDNAYKKLGQFFFHTYSLTCLKKDTTVLLKVINRKIHIANHRTSNIYTCICHTRIENLLKGPHI